MRREGGLHAAEAARHAEIVLVSVADDAAAEAVIAGPEEALSAVRPGAIIINTSMVSPGLCVKA